MERTLTLPLRAKHPAGHWVATDCNAVALEELGERMENRKIETALGRTLDLDESAWDGAGLC